MVRLTTEVLELRKSRFGLALLLCVLITLGGIDLGHRLAGPGPQLADCMRDELPGCMNKEFVVGGTVVFAEEHLKVRLVSRDLVQLKGWPEGTPLPSPGLLIGVKGLYKSNGLLRVSDVQLYPLGKLDMFLGVLGVALWLGALAYFIRHRWRQRCANG